MLAAARPEAQGWLRKAPGTVRNVNRRARVDGGPQSSQAEEMPTVVDSAEQKKDMARLHEVEDMAIWRI